jgi:hypothetical protein
MKKLFIATLMLLALASYATAACTNAFPTSTKQEFLSGTHTLPDTYKLAFYADTATYGAATTAYSATNEVSGTGYTAGGFIVADNGITKPAPTAGNSGTTGFLDFTDLAPTTITFDAASTCAVLYNSSKSNKVVAVYSFASAQPAAGTLTIDFPASGAATSPVRIALEKLRRLLGPAEAFAAERRDGYVRLVGVEAMAGTW